MKRVVTAEKLAYSVAEAAEASGRSDGSIRALIQRGDLPAKYPNSKPIVLVEDLEPWLQPSEPQIAAQRVAGPERDEAAAGPEQSFPSIDPVRFYTPEEMGPLMGLTPSSLRSFCRRSDGWVTG